MLIDILMLLASLGIILLASVLFTNAIEVFGTRLIMHQGTVGSVLAAIGTALPETVIPIIAILLYSLNPGDPAHVRDQDIAIGAIAGAPFMLGTLALFVTGLAVLVYAMLGRRPRTMNIDVSVLTRDLGYFIAIYAAAVATTFVHDMTWLRILIALVLLGSYVLYLRSTIASDAAKIDHHDPLTFARLLRVNPTMTLIVLQLLVSLGIMIGGAHLFVTYTEAVSRLLGVPALILSIIITPIATELPEKFNSVIWIGKKKDVLALGNITGAMVFQSCFPVAFGMAFTPWDLCGGKGETMASAVIALASAAVILVWVRWKKSLNPYVLLTGAAFYGLFLWFIFTR